MWLYEPKIYWASGHLFFIDTVGLSNEKRFEKILKSLDKKIEEDEGFYETVMTYIKDFKCLSCDEYLSLMKQSFIVEDLDDKLIYNNLTLDVMKFPENGSINKPKLKIYKSKFHEESEYSKVMTVEQPLWTNDIEELVEFVKRNDKNKPNPNSDESVNHLLHKLDEYITMLSNNRMRLILSNKGYRVIDDIKELKYLKSFIGRTQDTELKCRILVPLINAIEEALMCVSKDIKCGKDNDKHFMDKLGF